MAATPNTEPMNRETTFDLLSSAVRREIIAELHESAPVSRDRLAERLASALADGDDADADARRRMRVALHHNHLPRLADAGVVVYDDESVTGTDRLEPLARDIATFDRGDEPLPRA